MDVFSCLVTAQFFNLWLALFSDKDHIPRRAQLSLKFYGYINLFLGLVLLVLTEFNYWPDPNAASAQAVRWVAELGLVISQGLFCVMLMGDRDKQRWALPIFAPLYVALILRLIHGHLQ